MLECTPTIFLFKIMNNNDTIAAIATAAGKSGVAIVRISGSQALPLAQTLCHKKYIVARQAISTTFYNADGEAIDSGLLLYFVAPASFTGEDVVELHGHGGLVVVNMLLQRCLQLGARLARAGEFSQRAFLNNKMDLAQAESVADLIDASSETAAKMAMRSLQGVFSQKIHALLEQMIALRMMVEACLDFPEEEIDFIRETDAIDKIAHLQAAIADIQSSAKQGAILREGMTVVLIGAPNVGKSSLLNALAEDDVAIVTSIAGTTRDTVREEISLDGVPVHIVDTAGLRITDDIVEQKGIERSHRAAQNADIALILADVRAPHNDEVQSILSELPEKMPRLEIHNKIDLTGQEPAHVSRETLPDIIQLSAKTGAGLDLLKRALLQEIGWHGENEGLFMARARHLHALERAAAELSIAAQCDYAADLLAEHLRRAQDALNEITGEFTPDDLLGVIFSRFCIGK